MNNEQQRKLRQAYFRGKTVGQSADGAGVAEEEAQTYLDEWRRRLREARDSEMYRHDLPPVPAENLPHGGDSER